MTKAAAAVAGGAVTISLAATTVPPAPASPAPATRLVARFALLLAGIFLVAGLRLFAFGIFIGVGGLCRFWFARLGP